MKNTDFNGRGLLYRNPLLLFVPKEASAEMQRLILEVEKLYRIEYDVRQSGMSTHVEYRIICAEEPNFALCYWYIGQLYTHLIAPIATKQRHSK